jgi:hypothetical protein
MNETLERDSFEERLLPMLKNSLEDTSLGRELKGNRSERRRSTKRRTFVVLAAALAVLAGSLFAGSALGGRQVVKVDGLRALHDPAAVESELRDAGIDATIVEVPLSVGDPDGYLEGQWWWITVDQPEQLTQEEFARLYAQVGMGSGSIQGENTSVLDLPKMPGHMTLFVGGKVPAGQFTVVQYDRINELSPVGAFYCLGIDPNDPSALGAALEARGYRIIWNLESNNRNFEETAPPGHTVATWAWLRGPRLVDIRLAPASTEAERRSAAEYQSAEGTFPLGETPLWAQRCL